MRIATLTISDRCSAGTAEDTSGPALAGIVRERLAWTVVATACVPDDVAAIREWLLRWSRPEAGVDLILTTGGTGLSPRDVTPEAALGVLERQAPGLMELCRARGAVHTPFAYLSRGVAGTIGKTLIITLPGSLRGATESLEALLDVLPLALKVLRGDVKDKPREHEEAEQKRAGKKSPA